jgi:hypothetical protein
MSSRISIRPIVEKYSALPSEHFRVVDKFEDVRISEIRRGIIFVLAAWSGPSIFAFRKFTEILTRLRTDSLELIVLDIDCLTAESATKLFGDATFRLGGGGEVAWVRKGCIVSRAMSFHETEQILHDHTTALLGDDHVAEG